MPLCTAAAARTQAEARGGIHARGGPEWRRRRCRLPSSPNDLNEELTSAEDGAMSVHSQADTATGCGPYRYEYMCGNCGNTNIPPDHGSSVRIWAEAVYVRCTHG